MKKNNKEIIIEAAFLLALKNGFNNVSIKKIQEVSGFSAGSIYYHFKDKDEILFHMINVYLVDNFNKYRETVIKSNDPFIEKIESIFCYLLGFNKKELNPYHSSTLSELNYRRYFGLFSSIFHQHPETRPLFYKLHADSFNFYQKLVEEAIENNEIKEGWDVKSLTIFIHSVLKGYLDLAVFHPALSIEEIMNVNLKAIKEITKKIIN
ncbi:MAG: TetR/AcrR family transcriptional regulator [Methanobacteriaceae archaeon]|jgi:AcrR family transcriptional regulator|nr:TetR/AcrR family transcriptional regulator [Candidatus Methanorudis spinitermitis]